MIHVLQLMSKSSSGVRAKLVAREIDILQRELDSKAVVYVMGRAHMHTRSQAKSAFEWYAPPGCAQLVFGLCLGAVIRQIHLRSMGYSAIHQFVCVATSQCISKYVSNAAGLAIICWNYRTN